MSRAIKVAAKTASVVLLIIAVLLILGRLALGLLARAVDVSMFLVSVLAFPLILLVLLWFLYRVWGKPYFRAWRINRIRNARYLREAVGRTKGPSN